MISVLLTLLKIIGIVLLSLLGLFLVLMLIVLFVPVRYRIKGYYKDDFVCHGRATWLLHLVTVSIDFEKELITSFKILGMDISSLLNQKEDTTVNVGNEKKNSNKTPDTESEDNPPQKQDDTKEPADTTPAQEQPQLQNAQESIAPSKSSGSLFSKIKDFITGIKEKILSVYTKIIEIIQNIKNKKESLERYIRILQRQEVKGAFSLCKKRIIKMIKHLLPKHMKIHAHIGLEDPATTGYILAAYSILPARLHRQIILQAEFEEVILEIDYMIKGHCNAIRFLHEILCIVTDKNCRTFYKLVKKEISNERK